MRSLQETRFGDLEMQTTNHTVINQSIFAAPNQRVPAERMPCIDKLLVGGFIMPSILFVIALGLLPINKTASDIVETIAVIEPIVVMFIVLIMKMHEDMQANNQPQVIHP